MPLLDNLEPKDHRRKCKLGRIIDGLEIPDQQTILNALADEAKWSNQALTDALNERGLIFTTETLRSHRQNNCPCKRITE